MMSCSYKSKRGKKAERARYPQLHRSAVEHARVKKTVAVIIMSVIMRYFMLFLFLCKDTYIIWHNKKNKDDTNQ